MVNLKNNVFFKMFLMILLGVVLFTMLPVNVYATGVDKQDALYIDGHKISTIYYGETPMTRGFFDPSPFTFVGEMNGNTKYYDGEWMALEASATTTSGVIPVHIDLLVYNTNTHHDCTIWANGNNNKFDWISLGNRGGSSADNYYYLDSQYSNTTVTMDVKSYSWI